MAAFENFMGHDGFVWFVGVVEDRNDPEELGRVRVRCLGHHSESLDDIPTGDLPWAHVMHPVTDPSMQGLGHSPSFLVPGSWVIGFFTDAKEKQKPIIIGSLPGNPSDSANPFIGFNDPHSVYSSQDGYAGQPAYGPYPVDGEEYSVPSGHELSEPDTNRLARGEESEDHVALTARRANRQTEIPIATMPFIPTVENLSVNGTSKEETRSTWDEPHPKAIEASADPYTSGQYPYNHVFESESGHIIEIDDTPGGERLHREHMSGTFEEIHPKGDKMVKVIGDNYEIIAGDSKVLINGSVNLTIEGSVRELIKGDYVLEVEGNYTQKIHKSHRVKIGVGEAGGNREEQIRGNHSYKINDNVDGRIGGYRNITIEEHDILNVNDFKDTSVVNDVWIASLEGKMDVFSWGNTTLSTVDGDMSLRSGIKLNLKSVDDMAIKTEAALTETVATTKVSTTGSTWGHTSGGNITITAGPNIYLNP